MITTLTTQEAIELVPAIGATAPSDRVSSRYQFVSSKDILDRVQQNGWKITNASAQSRKFHAQHRITLVHENNINQSEPGEGIPRIEMFNSHDKTKRLMFAIGYFRFVCSNGLIAAAGPAETIRIKHRFSGDRLTTIMNQVSKISEKFPTIVDTINNFKSRELTEEEQLNFAEYAVRGRYNYRPAIPNRFREMNKATERILSSRRPEDNNNTVWEVYNRVQENLIKGIDGFSRPIRGYYDNVRVNQLLWKGAETALLYKGNRLGSALTELLVKDGKKGKISV